MKFRRLSNQAAGVVRVEMGKRIRGKNVWTAEVSYSFK